MSLAPETTRAVIRKYQCSEDDTGSAEVQVALLTTRIINLSEHFKNNIRDHHSRQGLLKMVSRRRKMLDYLKNKDITRYRNLISSLGLRR